jgi:PilZ domain-containing protein
MYLGVSADEDGRSREILMAQDVNEGVAYLLALRQSSGPNAPAVPPAEEPEQKVEATPAEEQAGNAFNGAEKRRSRRYKCEGSAEFREDGCEVRTWATFSDISLHGCYVEAQATYPSGTLLHMKMEADGIRFATKGTVRVTYPYLGMGIAFTDMSENNLVLLKQLLGLISRPCVVIGPGIASSLPATDPLKGIPLINDPQAAVTALLEYFESRQMLLRDDFVRILRNSQGSGATH